MTGSTKKVGARRPWLWPLVPVYAAVTGMRRWLAGWGLWRRRWLENPVISVGSCSAGGAGKTPLVLLLTRILIKRGYAVRILSRGYKRPSKAVERVDPKGSAAWFGDEPMLLARRSGAEVLVGADRYEAGLLAERYAPDEKIGVHVLDDGFQHWGLGRDVDIVLLTREDLEDALLPAGNLRESLKALHYADVIVLREDELAWTEGVAARMRKRGTRAPVIWVVRRRLVFREGAWMPTKPLVFCGIARPEGFTEMLRKDGLEAAGAIFFEDHHVYSLEDLPRLIEGARAAGADGFITTEKDMVKIEALLEPLEEAVGPVVVAKLELELVDEQAAMDKMILRVRAMERRRRKKVWR